MNSCRRKVSRCVVFILLTVLPYTIVTACTTLQSSAENITWNIIESKVRMGRSLSNEAKDVLEGEFQWSEPIFFMGDVLNNAIIEETDHIPKDALNAWIKMGKATKKMMDKLFGKYFDHMVRATYAANISQDCSNDLLKLAFGLRDLKPFAVRMLDATGKIPSGFVEGTLADLGHYEECLSINEVELRGKYCIVEIHVPLPPHIAGVASWSRIFNFTGTPLETTILEDISTIAQAFYERSIKKGVCIPANCEKDDLQSLIDTIFNPSSFLVRVDVSRCEVKQEVQFDDLQKVILSAFGVVLCLVALGSIVEFHEPREAGSEGVIARVIPVPMKRFLYLFSIWRNTEELYAKMPEGSLGFLNGIRVLTMFWMLLCHTYYVISIEVFSNSRHMQSMLGGLLFQGIVNGFAVVDTFFVLSSLLFSHSMFTKLKKNDGIVNIPRTIFLRIFRLGLPLVFLLLFAFIWPTFGSGPMWDTVEKEASKCQNGWLGVIFFINNILPFGNLCLLQTWFLGAELQMFLIFLPLVVMIYRWRAFGLALTGAIAIAGCIAAGLNVYINNALPTPLLTATVPSDVIQMIETSYLPLYLHLAPYAVGFILGYYLCENNSIKLTPLLKVCGNVFSLVAASTVVLGTYGWNNGFPMTVPESIIYAALHKITWSLCIAWVIVLCSAGHGGVVNRFLSWRFFVPLSRICYMVYLWHFYVLWTRKGLLRERPYLSHYTMICEFIVNVVFSVIVAFLAYLFFEGPFNNLSKEYFSKVFHKADWNIRKKAEEQNNGSMTEDASF